MAESTVTRNANELKSCAGAVATSLSGGGIYVFLIDRVVSCQMVKNRSWMM
ncbi:MAG: hypothetical protein V8R91_06310 [Butyricimonas faecihominis]